MIKKKGMSQTLALIVAASVLMMTALTVIFLTQGSLTDLGSNSARQSCLSAVQSQCSTALPSAGGDNVQINAPQQCLAPPGSDQTYISGIEQGSSGTYGSGSNAATYEFQSDGAVECSSS